MLFAESDAVEIAKTASAFLGPILLAYIAYLGVRASTKVKEVKDTLQSSTKKTDEKLDRVHDLVNSQLGRALSATATLARWKAQQTVGQPGSAGDIMAADIAERALAEHVEKQATADAADAADAARKKP